MKREWKERKTSLGNVIIVGAFALVVGVFVGANTNGIFNTAIKPIFGINNVETENNWSSLDEVYNKLNSTYNGEIDFDTVLDGAKTGIAAALGDKYTEYMNASKSEEFNDYLHGNSGVGIGVEMGKRDGYVRVLRTLPDNPARRAGILAGDIIYKVDGEEVWKLSSEEISSKLHGEAGTEVKVAVVRNGAEMEFTMKREEINNVSEYVEFDGSTAIITITRFDDDTGMKVREEVTKFADKGIKKVILDLRNNGGGYVSAGVDLLGLWLDNKEVLIQKSLHMGNSKLSTSSGKATLAGMKTIVLVNGSTASASEIVTGALQDYGVATVVGEKTYGKGVLQNLYKMSDGGLLKVTTAEWCTPKDRAINGEGITPDIEVERTYEQINKMVDPQMKKAKEL